MQILRHQTHLQPSDNDYDWLGNGIYFWEHAPRRALEFAREQKERGKVDKPAVLGAYINLGRCFDLTDIEHTQQLQTAHEAWSEILEKTGAEMPKNQKASDDDHDLLLRYKDCAVMNWYMKYLDNECHEKYDYQTVRGVFQEGSAVFDGSKIRRKTHIQVAVRDSACIVGYFLPSTFFSGGKQ